ncbi:phosphotransferase, partial [Shigella sonnei]|uniref:phosphotransferase n=1 Tax=Shigella sonnei TaxID=624 RepID=UPI0011BAA4AD
GTPVWVHGDISAGNLLVKNGKLCAVIDFGQLSVGDPACDLAITWTLFAGDSRKIFREMLALDKGTWFRGQAWALWKALIVAAGIVNTNAMELQKSCRIINELFLTEL